MQLLNDKVTCKYVLLVLLFLSFQNISLAADKVSSHSEDWYLQSWVWVLGGAVLLLLILALLSNNNHSTNK